VATARDSPIAFKKNAISCRKVSSSKLNLWQFLATELLDCPPRALILALLPHSGRKANYCSASFILWDIFGRFTDEVCTEWSFRMVDELSIVKDLKGNFRLLDQPARYYNNVTSTPVK
jgi:hypothetical protein